MGYLKVTALFVFSLGTAWAHPTTFEGGVAVTNTFRPKMSSVETNYTLHRNFAVGATYQRLRLKDRDLDAYFPQANLLLKRWNRQDSQGNIYLMGGAGYAKDSLESDGFVSFGAAQADWEDRRYYTAVKAQILRRTAGVAPYLLQYRAGFAPYEAKHNELQVWLIGQLDWAPKISDQLQVTPLFRFFYKNVLWEAGSTFTGDWYLQLMTHF